MKNSAASCKHNNMFMKKRLSDVVYCPVACYLGPAQYDELFMVDNVDEESE